MEVKYLPISDIKPYEKNPRKNKAAIDKVASSIKEFGFQQPIVVDSDNIIIVGHTRLLAAKKLKLKKVPVQLAKDLSEAQVKAYRIADNKLNEFAEWDDELLFQELEELKEMDFDIDLTGFDVVDEASDAEGGDTNEDGEKKEQLEISQEGDVWVLGDNKLIVGFETKEADEIIKHWQDDTGNKARRE
jgi:ParB-like chromosome segregation protein Spo0J